MTDTTLPPGEDGATTDRIEPVDIQQEMQRSYIDYAMSVIVGRALPEVRDGLKPVHRRVLYAMYDSGFRPDRGHAKSARSVAETMGNYHPHATRRSPPPWPGWPSGGRCATRWSTVRATSAHRATTHRRRCGIPKRASRPWRWR